MKKIRLPLQTQRYFMSQPLIGVTSQHQKHMKLAIEKLLSQPELFYKRFGRILYIGQIKYKQEPIQQFDDNWVQRPDSQHIKHLIQRAKQDGILNMLCVFNSQTICQYASCIQYVIQARLTSLKGIICIAVCGKDLFQLSPMIVKNLSSVLYNNNPGSQKSLQKLFKVKIPSLKPRKWIVIKKGSVVQYH